MSSRHICFSGGAQGADHAWGEMALDRGHDLIHFSFDGHKTAVDHNRQVLSAKQLADADQHLAIASASLARPWPTRNVHVNNLLRRNYFQVRFAERVYAVARLLPSDKGILKISGGTAWACQLFVDRWYSDPTLKECELYLYDLDCKRWMQWWETWIDVKHLPVPHGRYAGIGSRDISDDGIRAIFEAYG